MRSVDGESSTLTARSPRSRELSRFARSTRARSPKIRFEFGALSSSPASTPCRSPTLARRGDFAELSRGARHRRSRSSSRRGEAPRSVRVGGGATERSPRRSRKFRRVATSDPERTEGNVWVHTMMVARRRGRGPPRHLGPVWPRASIVLGVSSMTWERPRPTSRMPKDGKAHRRRATRLEMLARAVYALIVRRRRGVLAIVRWHFPRLLLPS